MQRAGRHRELHLQVAVVVEGRGADQLPVHPDVEPGPVRIGDGAVRTPEVHGDRGDGRGEGVLRDPHRLRGHAVAGQDDLVGPDVGQGALQVRLPRTQLAADALGVGVVGQLERVAAVGEGERPGRGGQVVSGGGDREDGNAAPARDRDVGRDLSGTSGHQRHDALRGNAGGRCVRRAPEPDLGALGIAAVERRDRRDPGLQQVVVSVGGDQHVDPAAERREEVGERRGRRLLTAVVQGDLAERGLPGSGATDAVDRRALGGHGQADGAVRDHVGPGHRDPHLSRRASTGRSARRGR